MVPPSVGIETFFYQSYILPSFDYCDVVWNGCTTEEAATLERLQNYAARLIIHQRKGYCASAAKKQLGLAAVSSCRAVHLAQQTAKSIRGGNPIYLKQLFTPSIDVHRHWTRHAVEVNVHLPLPRTNFGKKAFSYSGAAIWTSLPTEARKASTFSSFNSIIKPLLLNK